MLLLCRKGDELLIGIVNVSGINYINIVESPLMFADNEEDTLFSEVQYLTSTIRINADASPDRQEQTLVHEFTSRDDV